MRILLSCIVALGLTTAVQAQDNPKAVEGGIRGTPNLKSIEAIAFGPNGLLIIGGGTQVVTVETGDTKEIKWTKNEISNIDKLLADKLGANVKDIEIRRVAVNPASKRAYVAVRSLKANQYVILTIDGDGKVDEFSLDNVKFSRYPLAVGDKAVSKITDLTWAGNRIVVATQAGDTFGSRVFSINPTAKDGITSVSTETYHVGHGKWETKAPIICIMPYEEDGKTKVVGSFTCTPIVKYSLDEMGPDAKIKGVSVIELGHGNTPKDMFPYEKGGKKYILISAVRMEKMHKSNPVGPSQYWASRVDYDILSETKNVNEKALWRFNPKTGKASVSETDRAIIAKDYFGVRFMAKLDGENALTLRDDKSGLQLRILPLP
jgi:hypothetical protein